MDATTPAARRAFPPRRARARWWTLVLRVVLLGPALLFLLVFAAAGFAA